MTDVESGTNGSSFQKAYAEAKAAHAEPAAETPDTPTLSGKAAPVPERSRPPVPVITRPTSPAAEDVAQVSDDELCADFYRNVGPGFEIADDLVPAVTRLVRTVATSAAERALAPYRQQRDALREREAVEQTYRVMKEFGDSHPDWKEHEPAMLALSQKLQPIDMTKLDYLDKLHTLATLNARAHEAPVREE